MIHGDNENEKGYFVIKESRKKRKRKNKGRKELYINSLCP